MPAALPTTDCLNKTGYVFGIGTYDSPGDSSIDDDDLDHGVVALPPEARGDLSFLTDDMLYTEDEGRDITMNTFEPTLVRLRTSANSLPGDLDRPPKGSSNKEKSYKYQMVSGNGTSIEPYDGEFIYDARTSATELPHDEYTERAAVGYSDNTHTGNKKRTAEAELPGPTDNYQSLDNLLGALGNFWSGWELENVAQPISFPTEDRPYNWTDQFVNVPTGYAPSRTGSMNRIAVNIGLVDTLTADFCKKHGKEKNLTKRHIMAFLQENGYHVYLSSDIIRCLQDRNIYVADVLDQFPVKIASEPNSFESLTASGLIDIHRRVGLVYDNSGCSELKVLAGRIANVISDLCK